MTIEQLSNVDEMVSRLRKVGLSGACAAAKAELFRKCAMILRGAHGEDMSALFVPGRIEVLGKHTDYAGGRSVLAAAERGFCAVMAERDDSIFELINVGRGSSENLSSVTFGIIPEVLPSEGWANYPSTVARRLARNFGRLRGAGVAFASDLPVAAGMSSSSALVVLSYLVLAKVNRLDEREELRREVSSLEDLGGYLGTVENGQNFGRLLGDKGVGTFGGSEDHTAILCCRPGVLSQYSYCPVRFEREIPMPSNYVFAIASSGVIAEKTGAAQDKYNRLSLMTSQILGIWNERTGRRDPTLAAALESDPDAFARLQACLNDDALNERLTQFFQESLEIIPLAGDALAQGDVRRFAQLTDQSQSLSETLLRNQVPETIHLAKSARQLGAAAASAFGAGFGGSVWAMVGKDEASSFLAKWAEDYGHHFPECASRSEFFLSAPGPSATFL